MAKKKSWKDWAHGWVRKSGNCPGDAPAFGLPTDLMTEEEFEKCMSIADLHKWRNCHFGAGKDLTDPIESLPEGSRKLVVGKNPQPVQSSLLDDQRVIKMKQALHQLVDRIVLKDNGNLVIPSQLMNLKDFIGQFFDVGA
jgi:hypothetical protein